jgi:hypothetical protein
MEKLLKFWLKPQSKWEKLSMGGTAFHRTHLHLISLPLAPMNLENPRKTSKPQFSFGKSMRNL